MDESRVTFIDPDKPDLNYDSMYREVQDWLDKQDIQNPKVRAVLDTLAREIRNGCVENEYTIDLFKDLTLEEKREVIQVTGRMAGLMAEKAEGS